MDIWCLFLMSCTSLEVVKQFLKSNCGSLRWLCSILSSDGRCYQTGFLLHFHSLPSVCVCQDSEDDWVEAQPQTHAAKAWQVSDESEPSEKILLPDQNVQVPSLTQSHTYSLTVLYNMSQYSAMCTCSFFQGVTCSPGTRIIHSTLMEECLSVICLLKSFQMSSLFFQILNSICLKGNSWRK